MTALTTILAGMVDGTWAKVNLNTFPDAWPPIADRTTAGSPVSVIGAWSSFEWDSLRQQLMLFGGGHGNYAGNEMYLWSGTSLLWGLGTLPSKVVGVTLSNQQQVFMPVDFAAPPSMHSYDTNNYLPACDRFLVLGGPAYNASFGPVKADGVTKTGPFLWSPALADQNKVGGTDGSGYQPSRLGSNSWQNLDQHSLTFTFSWWFGERQLDIQDGTSAGAVEGGLDIVYFTGSANSSQFLARRTVDPAVPANNSMRIVGKITDGMPGAYGASSYCASRKLFVGLTTDLTKPIVVFDCSLPPPPTNAAYYPHNFANLSKYPTFPAGLAGYAAAGVNGLDYDPTTDSWFVWNGYGDVWQVKAPASGVITDPWTITQATVGANLTVKPTALNTYGGGVRGKFKFAAGPDCMLALDANADVWVYRQPGYTGGVGTPPPPPSITVTITPAGASLLTGSTQQFTAAVSGSSNQGVSWSVNGIAGGNGTVGTVSGAGLYFAPAAVPNPVTVTVRATAAANGTSYGEASVTISAAAPPPPPPPQGLAIEVTEADGSAHVYHGVLSVRAVQQ